MQQARKWNCGSLNEFRKFFGLKPHKTFEDINSDPYVADQLRHLYEHPDFVEMYPGIVAEEAKVRAPSPDRNPLAFNITVGTYGARRGNRSNLHHLESYLIRRSRACEGR